MVAFWVRHESSLCFQCVLAGLVAAAGWAEHCVMRSDRRDRRRASSTGAEGLCGANLRPHKRAGSSARRRGHEYVGAARTLLRTDSPNASTAGAKSSDRPRLPVVESEIGGSTPTCWSCHASTPRDAACVHCGAGSSKALLPRDLDGPEWFQALLHAARKTRRSKPTATISEKTKKKTLVRYTVPRLYRTAYERPRGGSLRSLGDDIDRVFITVPVATPTVPRVHADWASLTRQSGARGRRTAPVPRLRDCPPAFGVRRRRPVGPSHRPRRIGPKPHPGLLMVFTKRRGVSVRAALGS